MNDASRTQGWAICIAVALLALWFLIGLFQESYWALALPVAVLVFFVLGLAGWVAAEYSLRPGFCQARP